MVRSGHFILQQTPGAGALLGARSARAARVERRGKAAIVGA